jgi:hypothetical protein
MVKRLTAAQMGQPDPTGATGKTMIQLDRAALIDEEPPEAEGAEGAPDDEPSPEP